MTDSLSTSIDARGVATVTMMRPDVHNAFNDDLILSLSDTFDDLGKNDRVRVVVLQGSGNSFSAGADLDWMRKAAGYTEGQNHADARRLSLMLHRVNCCPKPVLALVQGAAIGGGAGLVACADIAIAVRNTKFGFSEVRLGLTPATISPYVLAKISESAARRYFLTGERFDATTACDMGLVHETVGSDADLAAAKDRIIAHLLAGAPQAQGHAKDLIFSVHARPIDAALREDTAARIAARRASEEGREGLAAFFEKRRPKWAPPLD